MDGYIVLVMGRSWSQLRHIATGAMTGIRDVLFLDGKYKDDSISLKKILKKEGAWAVVKDELRFNFDGNPREHTIWLTKQRRDDILEVLKKWINEVKDSAKGIPFNEFRWYVSELRNDFTYLPTGKGIL